MGILEAVQLYQSVMYWFPIKFIGTSEKIEGLEVFDAKRMADRILGFGDIVSFVEKAKNAIDEKKAIELNKDAIK